MVSCSPTKWKDTTHLPLSEVTKIDFLDDGKPVIYIKTDTLQGIILEDNEALNTAKAIKIEVGKKYPISLIRIDNNYRGKTDEYIISSSKGTEKVIWRDADGLPLVLYKAANLKGLFLVNDK